MALWRRRARDDSSRRYGQKIRRASGTLSLRDKLSDPSVYPLGPGRTLAVLGGAYLCGVVASLNQTITATALPRIVDDLGGFGHYSLVFTVYILASVITIPLFGSLSDVHGRRPILLGAVALFSAGCVVAGLAPSMNVLIAGRALQGLGAGGLGPLALAVIADVVAPRARGRWQAVSGAVLVCSNVGGPIIGGWLTDNVSWRLAFFASLPLAAVAVGVVWFAFDDRTKGRRRTIDYRGAALLVLGSGLVLYGVTGTDGGHRGSLTTGSAVPVAIGLLFLAAFLAYERRASNPILPVDLFRRRAVAASALGLFAVGASMLGAITYVPLFSQGVLHESATNSGTVLIPLTLSWIGASIVAGQIVSRTGRVRPVLLAGPPVAVCGFLLLATISPDASIYQLVRDVVLVGTGLGLVVQNFILVMQNSAPDGRVGSVTASAEFSRWTGALVGVAALGAVVTHGAAAVAATSRSSGHLASALHSAFLLGGGLAALGFVAALLEPNIELRATFDADATSVPTAEVAQEFRRSPAGEHISA